MSPAPKKSTKSTKPSTLTTQPSSSKPSPKPLSQNPNGSSTSNAYNPVSGTFHTLDTSDLVLNPVKFRSIDESDETNAQISPNSPNFDSASNHDSCSDQSEDHSNNNTNNKGSATTSASASNSMQELEKREKIRQKNEKKHQRQRERRAQELHEKCSGYLMSRKLEVLSQQLVAMGFTQEQATMALIQNEGKVNESVAWLFEAGEDSRQPEGSAPDLNCGVGLKIDISEELHRIAEYEVKYNCTKQEVERAVVNCEGDLVKAEEVLKSLKMEQSRPKTPPPVVSPAGKGEEIVQVVANQRPPLGSVKVVSVQQQQVKKGERDFNYAKNPVSVQVSDRPVNPLTQKQQLMLEKRWHAGTQNPNLQQNPSLQQNPTLYPPASSSSSSHMPVQVQQIPQVKQEQHYPVPASMMKGNSAAVGVTGQTCHVNLLREPVVVMQRPQQTLNTNNNNHNNISKQNLPSTSLGLGHQYTNGTAVPNRLGLSQGMQNLGLGRNNNNTLANGGLPAGASQHYGPLQNQNHVEVPVTSSWLNGSGLASPSSLGLFTGWGPNRSPSNNTMNSANSMNSMNSTDWNNNGGYNHNACDYTNIDWSLDLTLLNGNSGPGLSETWSTMFMGRTGPGIGNPVVRNNPGNGIPGSEGSRLSDWTSPFSGEDILGASRRFVMSPSCSRGGRGELE